MLPPVSLPRLAAENPAATAAALPPLDPPGTREVSSGLRVGPNAEFSVLEPIANSSRFVLPTITAPAAASRVTTVASYGGFQPSRILDEHVVGTPRVHMLSFSAIGTPASAPTGRPLDTDSSMACAVARADSSVTRLNAWISPSRSPIRARCSSSTLVADIAPVETWVAMSTAVLKATTTPGTRSSAALGSGRPPRQVRPRAPHHGRVPAARRRLATRSSMARAGRAAQRRRDPDDRCR